MSTNHEGDFLTEFKQFVAFARNLWGVLTGVSIFFPLSNVLLKVIPVWSTQDDPAGGWSYLSFGLITSLTTIVTLFVLLWTFGQRFRLRNQPNGAFSTRRAWVSLITGIIALIFYLGLHTTVYDLFYDPLNLTHGDPGRFIGDVFLLLFYMAFFSLMTRAFTLLAMREFYNQGRGSNDAKVKSHYKNQG